MSSGKNTVVGIAGRRGSGKSTILRAIAKETPRLFVWDPLGEHRWCPNQLRSAAGLERFLKWARGKERFAARMVPESFDDAMFDQLCGRVYRHGNVTFAIEEVAMISLPNWLPEKLDMIVRLGRHRGVNLIWTTQRLSEVARRLTSTTDVFILFAHHEPRDVDAIRQRCGVEVGDQVSRLGRHNFLCWDVLSGNITRDSLDGPQL